MIDKVPHLPLLQTLAERGINAHLLNWLYDYLSQRSQFVVVNGERLIAQMSFLEYLKDLCLVLFSSSSTWMA